MENIINQFYNGSVQNGGYKPKLTSNKFSSPNLLQNKYNRTNNNPYNQRYENGQRILENNPVPRTQYSMGLNVPTIRGNPPLNKSITNPFKTAENPYSTIERNYSPDKLKLEILNNKIRVMEDENYRNKLKIKRLMEGSNFGPENPFWNSNPNYVNNPNNLNEAMNNLRNPYLTMEEFKNRQDMRRTIVQQELEKARQRMNGGNINNNNDYNNNPQINQEQNLKEEEKNYTLSNYSSNEDSQSSSDESEKKMKKEYKKLIKEIKKEREYNKMEENNNMNNVDEKLYQMERQNYYNNEELKLLKEKNQEMYNVIKCKEEAEDFINTIPDHVALQLQNDNFKIRSNLNTIKEGFREIKNDLENKLENLELKQNYNFQVIKRIIEEGGNYKFRAGFRKYYDNEDIDLKEIQNELPEHLKFLPYLIEKKIKERDKMNNLQQNRLINERMNNNKFGPSEYDYGQANQFYKYKNNFRPNSNLVISKNYGNFQYIPKRYNNNNFNNNNNYNNNNNNFNNYNNKNYNKNYYQNDFVIEREKGKNIPGLYAFGQGNKNMKDRIPIRMNGCYDDWFREQEEGEYEVEHTESDIGLNAIKRKIRKKSNKSESLKSKVIKKSNQSKSSSKDSDKKNKKKNKKKEDKKKKEKSDEEEDEESEEESDEESEEKSEKKDKKENKKENKKDDKDEKKGGEENKKKEEEKKSEDGSDEEDEESEEESDEDDDDDE